MGFKASLLVGQTHFRLSLAERLVQRTDIRESAGLGSIRLLTVSNVFVHLMDCEMLESKEK